MVKKSESIELKKSTKEIVIKDLKISSQEVYNFLLDKDDLNNWTKRALIIGCVGLKQMALTENIDFVEKSFNEFLNEAKKSFEDQTKTVDDKLKLFFDMKNSDSMISKFKKFLDEQQDAFDMNNSESLFAKFKEFMDKQKSDLDETLDETFSMDNSKSAFFKFKDKLDTTFDMKHEDSPLNQFRELILEYFDKKNGKLQEIMGDYFDNDAGKIKKLLDKSFDIDNKNSAFSRLLKEIKENTDIEEEKIQELLDSTKTDSPLKLLKEQIFEKFKNLKEEDLKGLDEKLKAMREDELKDIRDEVLRQKAIEEEKDKGTQKGYDFEENVYELLEEISSFYEDKICQVGGVYSGRGKVGDICVDLDCNANKKIVIECKDSSSYKGSTKKTLDEINKAIKNRNAKFGIFVFAKKDQMPPSLRPIKITDTYIVTCFEKENLYIAYRLAKILLSKNKDNNNVEIDFAKVTKELVKIEEKLADIDTMQGKASNIINSGEYIRSNLGLLQSHIESGIDVLKILFGDNIGEVEEAEENSGINFEEETDNLSDEHIETISATATGASKNLDMYEKICPVCEKEFETISKSKKYCSSDCRDKVNKLRTTKGLTKEEKELKEKLEDKGVI
ncbi:MAG: hypothetical protein KAK00_08925 [Nanoarchaeota archaeon]|nr:hypothetical protein [Nanoarchaeota archaeon]